MNIKSVFYRVLLGTVFLLLSATAHAKDEDSNGALQSCLKTWGKHPFGRDPKFKTLSTSVKVFGIGQGTVDKEVTEKPALIMVNPGVNVMGGAVIELLNPNGWYCLKSTVNVMGGMNIKLQCNARLASANTGASVMSGENSVNGISVMGSIRMERIGC